MKRLICFVFPFLLGAILTALVGRLYFGPAKVSTVSSEAASRAATSQYWTCSMHPQIQLDHQDICPLCGMDLTPVNAHQDGNVYLAFRSAENNIRDFYVLPCTCRNSRIAIIRLAAT